MVKMSRITKMKSVIVMLILHQTAGVASNVHGEGHHHHDHNHVDHGDHHHHDHGGSGDCELDDSLAELIKSFGLAVLGKDQESADDVQPTEDHDHINIKALVEELFHPSTTQKTTTTTTARTTWTERLPIKSHDLGWDKSPVDLVMSNHLLEPVFSPDETDRQLKNFGATTQKPVYLTETHYYFPGDFSDSHEKDEFAPIEQERASKSLDLNLNLDASQLIDKPTIPVVDTRLTNFLLVNRGVRDKTKHTKPEQENKHIGENSETIKVINDLDTPFHFKQSTPPPFLIKFKNVPRRNNIPKISAHSKSPSIPSRGQISKRIPKPGSLPQSRKPLLNGRSRLNQLQTLFFQTTPATSPASIPKTVEKDRQTIHSGLKHNKHNARKHSEKLASGALQLESDSLVLVIKKSTSLNKTQDIMKQHENSIQLKDSLLLSRHKKIAESSSSQFPKKKGMIGFNGLEMMRMKEDKFECKGRPEGLHADVSSGCQRFYMCHENGRSGRFSCPAGTLFNTSLGVCDWAAKVKCKGLQP